MTEPTKLFELGQIAAEEQDRQLAQLDTLAQVRERLAQRKRRRGGQGALLVLAASAAALALLWWAQPGSRPLRFEVAGRPGASDAWIAAPEGGLPVRFSDGTTLHLASSAQARIADIDRKGARVVLERGRAELAVVHRPGTRWSVSAGPFEVKVTGTRFSVEWDASQELFHLNMVEGSVEVSSLCHREKRRFTAGERVSMGCKNTPTSVVAPEPSPAPTSSTHEPPLVPSAPTVGPRSPLGLPSLPAASNPEPFKSAPSAQPAPAASTVSPAPPASAEVPEPSWKELTAARRYREAMDAANARGFDQLCNTLDAGDLSLLGDVARFSGDTGRARQALTALRRRFPGDARSAASAFTLGRIAFDQQHSYGDAAGWFSTYLNEQPSGPFAQEALGRLIEARQRSGDLEGAHHAAQQYLLRFPGGAHEPFARKLTAP